MTIEHIFADCHDFSGFHIQITFIFRLPLKWKTQFETKYVYLCILLVFHDDFVLPSNVLLHYEMVNLNSSCLWFINIRMCLSSFILAAVIIIQFIKYIDSTKYVVYIGNSATSMMILRFCYWTHMKTLHRPLRYRKIKTNYLIFLLVLVYLQSMQLNAD